MPQSPKELFDAAYEEMELANQNFQTIKDAQTDYLQQISDARTELVGKRKALDVAAKELRKSTSGTLSGRPVGGGTPAEVTDTPAKKRTAKKKAA